MALSEEWGREGSKRINQAKTIRGLIDELLRELKRGKEMNVRATSSAGGSLIALLEDADVRAEIDLPD